MVSVITVATLFLRFRKHIVNLISGVVFLVPLCANAISDSVASFNTCNSAKQGAESGNADAQVAYGILYSVGKCKFLHIADPASAVEWWTKAAALGHPDGQFLLGVCYLKGRGVSKNRAMAIQLINQAAAHGSSEARNYLMLCGSGQNNPVCY